MSQNILAQFMTELVSGRIRLVDLTETLTPEFPTIVLPPEFGQAWPFRIEEISRYDARPGLVLEQLLLLSTPARTSTRRRTGSPARTSPTTQSTRFRWRPSSPAPA